MIWTFVGEHNAIEKEVNKLVSLLHKKQPDAETLRMNEETFDPVFLDEIISSQGLFSPKYIVIIESIDLKSEKGETMLDKLVDMKAAEHAFVISFPKLLAEPKKKFQKHSYEYKEYESTSAKATSGVKENNFEMADRIGERDVIGLWQVYAKKITDDTSPEEIHGMFVWQIKGMLLAMKTKVAGEAHMNDFPYSKAKRYSKNFSQAELEQLLFELMVMYDKAHAGKADLPAELERWVLKLGKK
ncbi:MAG: hypothetical protein RLY57_273 [Candidatus Parcubacteria bacterium]|jgi:hypothetical protein